MTPDRDVHDEERISIARPLLLRLLPFINNQVCHLKLSRGPSATRLAAGYWRLAMGRRPDIAEPFNLAPSVSGTSKQTSSPSRKPRIRTALLRLSTGHRLRLRQPPKRLRRSRRRIPLHGHRTHRIRRRRGDRSPVALLRREDALCRAGGPLCQRHGRLCVWRGLLLRQLGLVGRSVDWCTGGHGGCVVVDAVDFAGTGTRGAYGFRFVAL